MIDKMRWCVVMVAVTLTSGWSQANEPKLNPTLWLGIFKPMTERLNADWAVGADFHIKGSTYLALRYFQCKDATSPATGKSLAASVGFSIPLSSTEGNVNYRLGIGVGLVRAEASGQERTHRGMLEGFMEAKTGSFGVRLGCFFGGLDATNGWFVALLWKF
ncbi:hypothetical protein GG496_000640 [Candidatus Fervidibacteria bacterium JGI MDM2 JNZ-1-D12]